MEVAGAVIANGAENMNRGESQNDYWATFWTSNSRLENDDPHFQVGRTINGVPLDQEKWQFHLNEIAQRLDLNPKDTLLDLCAGNGLITMPLSLKCRATTAIDISTTLLGRIDSTLYPSITVITADARNVDLLPETFSKVLMYGALQHFSDREAIGIFETTYQSLIKGGSFLIGDIPDIDRLFVFYNKPEWVKAYFDSVRTNTPAIGTWFKKEVLVEMAKYVGFSHAEVATQHPDMINSHYRFDLLLTK